MIIKSSEYIISAVGKQQYPKGDLPEIALVGRSNVGKSSLINKVINRKGLARTSGRPGKTQTLNFYLINQDFYFVDLPGYGFAKVSQTIKAEWSKFIEEYLLERETLKGVIQIVDIRHLPTADDRLMYQWLMHHQKPNLVVITKADKISRGKWSKHLQEIKKEMQFVSNQEVVLFSAETGQGLPEVREWVKEMVL